jgi:hypothetical protein
MIVGVPLELPHVTAIGEVELPEVGVHEGVAAAVPAMVKSPSTNVLGKAAPDGVPAIANNFCVDETLTGPV